MHDISFLKRFWKDDRGATSIEYGLIAGGISIVILAAVNGIGESMQTMYENVSSELSTTGE